jgi:UDP-2-acetamido-3-amino-2,3-dideoxy-glucuronate N-acetyltransferase
MSALDTIHRQVSLSASAQAPLPQVDPFARIDPSVVLPDDIVVKSGAYLPAGLTLEGGCHIGPNVAFVDGRPISVGQGVWIGANAIVHAGISIAAKAVVRPGSVVGRSVPPGAIVEGNPAAIVGYVNADREVVRARQDGPPPPGAVAAGTAVRGVSIHHFPLIPDLRGHLTVGEFDRQIPFLPKRYFMVFGVPNREVRGEHAHRVCHQFLVCPRGDCSVVADDGTHKVEVLLDTPHKGLYLPPMTWGIQYKHSPDAVLLVFASHHYDAADYIREYDDFLRAVRDRELPSPPQALAA